MQSTSTELKELLVKVRRFNGGLHNGRQSLGTTAQPTRSGDGGDDDDVYLGNCCSAFSVPHKSDASDDVIEIVESEFLEVH